MTPQEQIRQMIDEKLRVADAAQAQADAARAEARTAMAAYLAAFGPEWGDGRRLVAGRGGTLSLRSARKG